MAPATFADVNRYRRGFHQGLDIPRVSAAVYVTDGTVELASSAISQRSWSARFRLSTRYGHLSRFKVKTGLMVVRGDVIGYVGSTGRSTGAHPHYEILANDKLINPLQPRTRPNNADRAVGVAHSSWSSQGA
jgi:murein DD-endopeptidase MepM/ murein hydrolase activator NlpD